MLAKKSLTKFLPLFFIAIASPAIAIGQNERPTGNSIISGRVFHADTGRPVRRAAVMLYSDLTRSPIRVTPANGRGEFRFNEVAAGSYFVLAETPGIVSPLTTFSISELGISGSRETNYTRVTVDGSSAIRCELKLNRAGTIKGTMTYDDKEPIVNARIVLYRRKDGVLAPFFIKPVLTNDRGMYRIDGLPDGEYFVGLANGQGALRSTGNGLAEPGSVTNAFYPGVRTLAEAKSIQIQSGAEVGDVSMVLNDDVLRQVSGTIKWRDSLQPVTEGRVSLVRKEDPKVAISFGNLIGSLASDEDGGEMFRILPLLSIVVPASVQVDRNGEWTFKDLAPGTYVATAVAQLSKKTTAQDESAVKDPREPPSLDSERPLVSKQVELTIDQEDLKDVTIELSEGGRILGTVVQEDSPSGRVMITIGQKGAEPSLLNLPLSSREDGTFIAEGVQAGEVVIDVEVALLPDTYLKSITLGSQDLMREPLRMTEGAEVTGVRITLGSGLATVKGHANAAGAGVLLVRADQALWHLASSLVFSTTDATGDFTMKCAPGDYLVFTWPAGEEPGQKIEDFVRAQAAYARRITLQSNEEKELELTLSGSHKKAQKAQ